MPAPDTVLQGRYRIVRQLGRGGMGAVYEAVDERLSRTVALKETLAETDDLKRAFEREARLLANLSHPALPKVIDHFTEDDGQFVVMEYMPGSDLGELLERRGQPFSPTDVLRWADDLLDALEYLHTFDPPIIHRDIKPSNLKLTSKGRIILLDFGLAKGAAGQMTRTTSGMSVVGYTLHYAALEQIQGERTSPRSDLYSLAATLYQLLTGRTPVDALKRAADLLNDEADPLTPIRALNPGVPSHFAEVLMRSLSIKPSLRPASAADMRAALNDAPAVFAHVAPVEEDEMTKVSVTPGRSGRLPPIAIGGDKTIALATPPPGRTQPVPNGSRPAWLAQRRALDTRRNNRKWWLVGGGAVLIAVLTAVIVLLALRSNSTTVTPATAPAAYDAIPSPYREALSSVATLTMQDAEGKTVRQASGFFLTTDELATSLSAVEGATRGRVALVGQNDAYDITNVTGVDREHGVVILKIAKAKASGLGFSSRKQTTLGDRVALIGSAGKSEPAYAQGAISSYRDDDRVEVGAQAGPTVVGGPLLNAEGEVIGVVTDSNGSRVLAVPVSYLADLLNHRQQPVSLAFAAAKDVLYDWRKKEPAPHPELAKDLEQKIITEVARAHDKAPAPAPAPSPQESTPAETVPSQGGGFWQDEMSSATVSAVAEGSFTQAGAKQTAYIIDTHSGTAANNGGPKYLAIFSGETYVVDVPVPNLSLILQIYDLNRDGVNELLLGYYQKQMGQIIEWAKLVQLAQGQLRIIKDFGTTYASMCEVSPEKNPGTAASAIFYAMAAAGQMPELRVDNYQAACAPEGTTEQWKYTPLAKLPDLSK
ncbi:MAG TPA: protein kinase [Pyrinomonadaceae bacterium]